MENGTFYYLSDTCDFQQVFENLFMVCIVQVRIFSIHTNIIRIMIDVECGFWLGGEVYALQ